jgi:hypothetical protein
MSPQLRNTNANRSMRREPPPAAAYGSVSPFKSAVNREFTDTLAKGSIDDVGALIENSTPQPEVRLSQF